MSREDRRTIDSVESSYISTDGIGGKGKVAEGMVGRAFFEVVKLTKPANIRRTDEPQ